MLVQHGKQVLKAVKIQFCYANTDTYNKLCCSDTWKWRQDNVSDVKIKNSCVFTLHSD
jgi:hypothetical protein